MLKHTLTLLVIALTSMQSLGQGFGISTSIKDWHFHLGDVKLGGRETLNHSKWDKVTVPHDWSVTQPASPDLASCTGYLPGGIAWYRTQIDIPTDIDNKRFYLYFEGVYNNSEVFINGKWLGKRPNGYVSFSYEITPFVKAGQANTIAVRVDHSKDADSRWYTGSGIYRDVHLITANATHLAQWGTAYTTNLKGSKATLNVTTDIDGPKPKKKYSISQQLYNQQGNLVGESSQSVDINSSTMQSITVDKVSKWGPNSPYLYTLKTTLYENKKAIDKNETTVGFRKLEYDANKGFAINGERTKIKGVCLHHDAGVLGAAVPKAVWRRRLEKLQEIGVNGIRMSHNPQATDLYDLCDEMGFLVMNEAFDEWEYPKKKWIKGWNAGKPGFQGYAEYFREWSKRDLESFVLRDRNHPSIVMWSIGNEVDYPNDPYSHPVMDNAEITQKFVKGYLEKQPHADRLGDIAKELVPIVKQLDDSRPVTAALAGVIMSNETEYPSSLDIAGYNYTESRYDMDHAKYPNRVIYGSETRHDMKAWKAVRDNDFIFGQFIWTGLDYLGEAGRWPSRGFTSGMVDLANNIKPRGRFRQSLWSDKPMVYIGTYPQPKNPHRLSIDAPALWNYPNDMMVRVVAYTNTEKVQLFLNDKPIGESKNYNDNKGIIYWDIPYESGELKAVGYAKDGTETSFTLRTSQQPRALKVATQSSSLKTGEVAILEVSAVDTKGLLSKLASNTIHVQVEGGRLLGIENASRNVAENYRDNKHDLKGGKATVYVEALGGNKPVKVNISSPYLEPAIVTFDR